MLEWWSGLGTLAQVLFVCAVFFTALLVLQLAFSFGDDADDGDADGGDADGGDADGGGGDGVVNHAGGDADIDHDAAIDHDADIDHAQHQGRVSDDNVHAHVDHGSAAGALWRGLASRRSLFAFATLFSWGGALYLQAGRSTPAALGLAAVWGAVGSVAVAGVYLAIRALQSPGERFSLDEAVGEEGTVYLRIPVDGVGQVRVPVAGRLQVVRARSAGGGAIAENTPIYVTRAIDARTVEVIPAEAITG